MIRKYLSILALIALGLGIAVGGRHLLMGGGRDGGPNTIGGPFTLVDQTGRAVTDKDFQGKFMLVYFGYTFCPDVCPTSLTTIAEALDLLGPRGEDIVPVLITVDPERDTPQALAAYVPYFHPRLVGLSGTPAQVAAAAKAYKAFYAKVREKDAPEGEYLMDHSAFTYLMGRDGKLLAFFPHGMNGATMAERIKGYL